MGAEVTFLCRVIFGINKDGIVRTGSHAGFAADTDRFIEIDYAVRALEHRGRRASSDARRMRALIAARHLMGATDLWKHSHVDVLDVSPRDADGHDVFRLARRRARMTTDAAGVVDDLGPLDPVCSSWLLLKHVFDFGAAKYIMDCGRRGDGVGAPQRWRQHRPRTRVDPNLNSQLIDVPLLTQVVTDLMAQDAHASHLCDSYDSLEGKTTSIFVMPLVRWRDYARFRRHNRGR